MSKAKSCQSKGRIWESIYEAGGIDSEKGNQQDAAFLQVKNQPHPDQPVLQGRRRKD